MTTPMPDRTPTGDLCDQLAQEIHLHCPARPYGGNCRCTALATAVLPVVEAETADLKRELEQLRQMYVSACTRAKDDRDDLKWARSELAKADAENRAAGKRAEEAERQRDEALAALRDLIRVAAHVSRGRSAVDVGPYPDALARKALGALDDATVRAALEPPEGT